jgi:hypothetical protein
MTFRMRIEMTAERRAEVKAAVQNLVDMRNELVHHLIDRFDVWTEDGCDAAIDNLNACYDRINRHFEELQHWARHMAEAAANMATFAKSGGFEEALINGIAPDGTFEWPNTGIVRVLRAALDVHAVVCWGRLNDAKAWIAERYPEQTPDKYGCRSWPQVLHESRGFQLEYRQGDDERKVAWYRAR